MNRLIRQLWVQMIAGIVIGTLIGYFWPDVGIALAPLGVGFVKAMRMMVPPILLCTIVEGIVGHGGARRTGSTFVYSVLVFFLITCAALAAGLVATLLLRPGEDMVFTVAATESDLTRHLATKPIHGPGDFFLRLIPDTFFSAFTAGDVLPVLFVAALVGFGLLKIGAAGEPIVIGIRALTKLQFAIFGYLIRAAPIGACGALAYTVGTYGLSFIGSLGMMVVTLAAACGTLVLGLLAIVRSVAGFSPVRLFRHFREELLVIVGTSSTEVVLPRLISRLEQLGCPPSVVGLTVPLGYTLNLAGTAVYLITATLFLSEVLDIDLSVERIAVYLLLMLATSKTAAGVTGSGFSALLLTLSILPDIPASAAAMLIAIDRVLSVIRALTSALANVCASIVISRFLGMPRPPKTPLPTPQ